MNGDHNKSSLNNRERKQLLKLIDEKLKQSQNVLCEVDYTRGHIKLNVFFKGIKDVRG